MIHTELTDIVFKSKQGGISLASLNLHVERHGVNSIFMLPSYSNVNVVDWKEYDGADVDFSSASVDALPLELKIFGEISDVDSLVNQLRGLKNLDVEVQVKIKEDNLNNSINFSTKYINSVKSKAVVFNDWQLEHFLLTDEDSDYITNEVDDMLLAGIMMKKLRQIAFVSITFSRYNNDEYFGLLADNTKSCEGIPYDQFKFRNFPSTNVPIEFRRYHVVDKQATQVSSFALYDNLVYCYPLKGVVAGMTNYAESKEPFEVQPENMVGKVLETKMADKRTAKNITIPLLIRSHSVSAIFFYLGKLKKYIHDTLKGGDMLYICGEQVGDMAVYPTGCTISKSYIQDMPWVEMTLQMSAYKEGFDYTADTDNVPEGNPEPPLPPAPPATFDPYKGIDKTAWRSISVTGKQYRAVFPLLVSPAEGKYFQYPMNCKDYFIYSNTGWSDYAKWINRYPVGTLFFFQENSSEAGTTIYNTLVCLPWAVDNLSSDEHASALAAFAISATLQRWSKTRLTLVGVVQGCEVLSNNIHNWNTELQPAPSYGGIVGTGKVMVHSSVKAMFDNGKFDLATGLTLSACSDFDLLVNNVISEYNEDPKGSGYYTEIGYQNTTK